ncbi:hypothetical protein [Streptomyces sp. NPDC059828]|uniref:hypothetical protein n=1 Tax=Streptomyces sp. NPDC059828 TaxID=3346965 RepID=UPI00365E724C
MSTFLSYVVVLGILVVVGLPSFVGHLRDRAIDRQLRDAERPMARTAVRAEPSIVCGRLSGQKSSSRSTEPSTAT